ncbi:MAG: glycosyl hydrolase family 18 protein [Eubacteriales bacterium]|nr:glycosyl hydrolase family 18 protein [Eubacteriales bacterium]MDD4390016.1 glycosyl hydrolase family 18 protein [Eubacteriales bacterium]
MYLHHKKILAMVAAIAILSATCFPLTACAALDGKDAYRIEYRGSKTSMTGYYENGTVYLPIDVISKYSSNNGVAVNASAKKLSIDISSQNIIMADDKVTSFVKSNAGKIYIPLTEVDDNLYFPINVMEQFLKLSYSLSDNKIKLFSYSGADKIASIHIDAMIISSLSHLSDSSKDTSSESSSHETAFTLKSGERIFIKGQTDNYYKIEDIEGRLGYVMKGAVKIEDLDLSKVDFYAPKKIKFMQKSDEKINGVWQYVANVIPAAPQAASGIDIVMPTWFRLNVECGGEVSNSADKGYTDIAHKNGFLVWATITNNMSATGSTNFTSKMFTTPSIENKAIAQYLLYSCLYGADGINIDFEDVKDADRNGLTSFTAKMRTYTERQGLNLSIDVMLPKPWTIEYDRAALSKHVDYVAVMSYDEHYSGSAVAGSISSMPFVEEAIEGCLDEGVPADKLLMGVPLYTRIWVMDASGKKVSNTAATMPQVQKILSDKGLTPTYLSKVGQNYVEYPVPEGTAKIWIEDQTSITNRLEYVDKYGLAGTACWQYSQGSNDIWPLFDRYLH